MRCFGNAMLQAYRSADGHHFSVPICDCFGTFSEIGSACQSISGIDPQHHKTIGIPPLKKPKSGSCQGSLVQPVHLTR